MFEGLAAVEVINLVRRTDRLAAFREEITSVLGTEAWDAIRVREAVDRLCLVPTPELEELFAGNCYGNRRSKIACSLSHALAWADVAQADGPVLLFEDDVTLVPDFADRLRTILAEARDRFPCWDVVLLGYHAKDGDLLGPPDPQRVLSEMRWDNWSGGRFAYLLSPSGAHRLLALAEVEGFPREGDLCLELWREHLQVLETNPRAVLPDYSMTTDIDVDIGGGDLWFE